MPGLAGCIPDGGPPATGSTGGAEIGARGGESAPSPTRPAASRAAIAAIDPSAGLPRADSALRFGSAEPAVTGRERLGLADRYGEIARLEQGYIRYQRLYTGSFAPAHDSAAAAALAYRDAWFADQRFASPPEWRLAATPAGPMTWTAVNSHEWRCVLFGRVYGEIRVSGSRGDREIRGINCRRLDDPRLGALEADTLNLLQHLRASG